VNVDGDNHMITFVRLMHCGLVYVGQRDWRGKEQETWSAFIPTIQGSHVHSLSVINVYVIKSLELAAGRFG
jgi:hypothetical protein